MRPTSPGMAGDKERLYNQLLRLYAHAQVNLEAIQKEGPVRKETCSDVCETSDPVDLKPDIVRIEG